MGAPESSRKLSASQVYFHNDQWVGIATQKADNTLLQALGQNVFCTAETISLKKQRKTLGAQLSKLSLPQHSRGLSLCIGCDKESDKRDVDLTFSRAANTKREKKKAFQASIQVISGSHHGRRAGQQQEESLLSVIYTKTTESICKPDWLKSVSLLSASRLSGYRMAL